ncbi:FAD-dependent 5-carboxymethylaminomethyl-2-thiouridine(34) oxidoreductase MnmC [Tepidicella baoligensis]|uniref:FAD-dependent 5-carboxymethylaminomethyl-2-thiouridine(34) oxidoreductase MnmC n=1 Tax=Tepidicella baoligensis TaxID=2707016 RepID=UPI0015D9DC50|nr:FAD-dependent 5-carboxymethylaminomethyl-2-thiouridine(34) oxidoreductase MnmC [Tepidicella baoligensis]
MAHSPVAWQEDGTPHSPRFHDIYRSRGMGATGPWDQARTVFLGGCRLLPANDAPAIWSGQRQWHVLETGFGLGLNFLATWDAWRRDHERPGQLFFTSVEAWPVTADDLLRGVQAYPTLQPLAQALAQQWKGLLPGTHRLVFEDGRVHLTLRIGHVHDSLAALDIPVDSVFLDGFSPQTNPDMWDEKVIAGMARLCRPGTRVSTWTVARSVRDLLVKYGFEVTRQPGCPPKRERLEAKFEPRWPVRRSWRSACASTPSHAVVLGAGLAGSAVAWSLAQRGWRVDVLDAADRPAAGASGLPAGLIAPHVSPDDAPLSRLSRAGVRATLLRAQSLLTEERDWAPVGVLEHRVEGKRALPPSNPGEQAVDWMADWSAEATADQLARCALPDGASGLWHGCGAWMRPASLVQAHLSHPLVRWQGKCQAARICREGDLWAVRDASGQCLAQAAHLILACAYGTRALLAEWLDHNHATLPLNALRGQVSWGNMEQIPQPARQWLPAWPVNGHGSFIHGVPSADGEPIWIVGSTFERGQTQPCVTPEDHAANRVRLERLLPSLGRAMGETVQSAQGWAGVRCTLPDRLPAVGPLDAARWPGLHVFTGLGARGLTLSVLGAEILAAQWHGEPWPVDAPLARAMLASRFATQR